MLNKPLKKNNDSSQPKAGLESPKADNASRHKRGGIFKNTMLTHIQSISKGQWLQSYSVRDLVQDAEELGSHLKNIGLKTNQIRKFLDALNRLKVELYRDPQNQGISVIKNDLLMLKPKLVYSAARQRDRDNNSPVDPLKDVILEAIGRIDSPEDFNRLVQIVEAVIAYHKAAGGEN
jgi:CRISPR-associated protein Csm2